MRTRLWAAAILLVLAVFLATAGAAQAGQNIRCDAELYTDADMDHWQVTLTGDLSGTMYVHGGDRETVFPGKTEHFWETFIVYPASGGWFSGVDAGVWSFVTFKFRSHGQVTDASPRWHRMIGYRTHSVGTSSDPFTAPGPDYAITGLAQQSFVGP